MKEEETRLPGKSFNPDTEGEKGGQNRMGSNPGGHLEPLDKCGYPRWKENGVSVNDLVNLRVTATTSLQQNILSHERKI